MLSDASSQAVSSTSDSLDDEYGEMTSDGQTYRVPERFVLESGRALDGVEVRYATYGELNAARTNCVVVCHALTGNHDLASWWGEMLGSGNVFDTDKFFVVCANMLGSCYGTTGPTSFDSRRQRRYGASFPDVTVRDSVRAHCAMVTRGLGVRGVACVVGGSLGGMQALEWGAMYGPDAAMPLVRSLVVLCAGSHHHAWQIGVSEAQRQAIYADPDWREGWFPLVRVRGASSHAFLALVLSVVVIAAFLFSHLSSLLSSHHTTTRLCVQAITTRRGRLVVVSASRGRSRCSRTAATPRTPPSLAASSRVLSLRGRGKGRRRRSTWSSTCATRVKSSLTASMRCRT